MTDPERHRYLHPEGITWTGVVVYYVGVGLVMAGIYVFVLPLVWTYVSQPAGAWVRTTVNGWTGDAPSSDR
jgi:hypothetical protein